MLSDELPAAGGIEGAGRARERGEGARTSLVLSLLSQSCWSLDRSISSAVQNDASAFLYACQICGGEGRGRGEIGCQTTAPKEGGRPAHARRAERRMATHLLELDGEQNESLLAEREGEKRRERVSSSSSEDAMEAGRVRRDEREGGDEKVDSRLLKDGLILLLAVEVTDKPLGECLTVDNLDLRLSSVLEL